MVWLEAMLLLNVVSDKVTSFRPSFSLFCSEGLSSLLGEEERKRTISGACFGRNNLHVSHLLFANDSLIFFRARMKECTMIVGRFATDSVASGQSINLTKSEICFGRKIKEDFDIKVARTLGVKAYRRP